MAEAQISMLHAKFKKDEWSGIVTYEIVEGSVKDLNKLVIRIVNVLPVDVGSSVFTGFKYSGEVADLEDKSGSFGMSHGKIHSHHDMDAYFSSTDWEDLEDVYKHYNMYLSLIVNFKSEYCAKIAFKAPNNITISYEGKNIEVEEATTIMITCDCLVTQEVDEWFQEKVIELKKKQKEEAEKKAKEYSYNRSHTHRFINSEQYKLFSEKNKKEDFGKKFQYNNTDRNKGYRVNEHTVKMFTAKLLSLDLECKTEYKHVIRKLDKEFNDFNDDDYTDNEDQMIEAILNNYDDFFNEFFAGDVDIVNGSVEVCNLLEKEDKNVLLYNIRQAIASYVKESHCVGLGEDEDVFGVDESKIVNKELIEVD